jgi:membrane protein DedA with SNARE-associated domain
LLSLGTIGRILSLRGEWEWNIPPALALTYGYLLIFAVVFLEQAAPSIPSPPFVTAMGVFASRGSFNISLAFVVVFSAAFVADCLWFRIDCLPRTGPLDRRAPGILTSSFFMIVNLDRRGVLGAILSVKFSLLPSAMVPLAAGSTRLTTRRFLYMAGVGNLAWTAAYLIGGFHAGYAITNVLGCKGLLVLVTLCGLLLVLPSALRLGTNVSIFISD